MKVKHNAANIGDLLKHSWLIEVTAFLSKQFPTEPFRYADTFCGFKEYEIENFFKERLINHFRKQSCMESRRSIWKETGIWAAPVLAGNYSGTGFK